jgi:hypothetical protein
MRKEENFLIYSREFFYAQFFVLKFLTKHIHFLDIGQETGGLFTF